MVIMGDITIWGFINLIFGYKIELAVSDVFPLLKNLRIMSFDVEIWPEMWPRRDCQVSISGGGLIFPYLDIKLI